MATPQPWTTTDDDLLRDLHAAETPIRTMAERLGRSKSVVGRRLTRLGLSSANRDRTEAATRANTLDAKARRTALQLALLEDAEKLRSQLFAPTVAFNFGGKDNTYEEHQLPEPTFADKLKIVQAVGIAVDRHLKIAVHDADNGTDQAVGMLDSIAAAITAAADKMTDPDTP